MQPESPRHHIAMWGAPGSGKTTLLAALSIALNRREDDWKIIGQNPESTAYLTEMTSALTSGKEFPEASTALETFQWALIGPAQRSLFRRQSKRASTTIGLTMVDAPGGHFAPGKRGGRTGGAEERQEELMANLTQSRGIVFLFDPIREFEVGDAYDHLHGPLNRLAEKMLESNEFIGGKLPHHIAVCITKFDDPRVLQTAQKRGLIELDDRHRFPRVGSDEARDLFGQLSRVSATGTADMVINSLDKFFHESHIKFYVTSSIGFYVNPQTETFDWNDYLNLIPDESDHAALRIRGPVYPINVVEPMLWLGERLSRQGRSR
ncbi:ATP-binding protein [Herbidospora cretacea]|uniref:ATP-binding protein n=1 Tax=Herbidospora cretacea TaxID=28444 RepID=UPI0004C41DEF|nr:ATP-binding protein [Herbidospora cretacea]